MIAPNTSETLIPRTELGYPSRPQAWWLVAVLFLTALISYTDRLILGVLVDPLRGDLGLTDSSVSLLQGVAFTIVYVFASLPVGRLADRGPRKALLVGGATVWCVAAALCGLAPNFGLLFAGRLLIGVGEAVLVPTAISLIADAFPAERRGFAIGLLSLGTIIGGPFGISIGGLLLSFTTAGHLAAWPWIGQLAPWRQVLVIVGAAGLLAPALLLTVKEPVRREQGADLSLRAAAHFFRASWRRLSPLYAALAMLSIGDYGLLSWAPTTLSRRFDWPADRIGIAFGVITAVAAILGAVAGGWVSDRADQRGGPRARLAICVVAAAIALVATLCISLPSANAVLAGIGLWTLGSAIAGTSAVAALQGLLTGTFRATGMAVFTFTNTLVGLGAGPTLVAVVTDHLYSGPAALAHSITTTVGPAAVLGCVLFTLTRARLGAPEASVT